MPKTNKIFRYKTTAPISFVDETLFESPKRTTQDPSERSVVISWFELERIRKAAYVWTVESKEMQLDFQRRERAMAKKAAEERIAKIRQADFLRRKKQGLSRGEAGAQGLSPLRGERTQERRMEDDPEMKSFNAVVRGVKCLAEWDVQVQERRQALLAEEEEDRRLDVRLEQDRLAALRAQEQAEARRQEERSRGKIRVQEQIEERIEERWLQEEMKQQEKQKLLENLEQMKMDDLQAQLRKKEVQRRLQQEVLGATEQSEADMLLVEIASKKMDQETVERQKRRGNERDLDPVRALGGREKAVQEEQRMRRTQDAWENEGRRREREQARQKVEDGECWRLARQEQLAINIINN